MARASALHAEGYRFESGQVQNLGGQKSEASGSNPLRSTRNKKMPRHEQLNFLKKQEKKKIDPTLEEPKESQEEIPQGLSEEDERWLLKQQEGEGNKLITDEDRKKRDAKAEEAVREWRGRTKKLFPKQEKLNLKTRA